MHIFNILSKLIRRGKEHLRRIKLSPTHFLILIAVIAFLGGCKSEPTEVTPPPKPPTPIYESSILPTPMFEDSGLQVVDDGGPLPIQVVERQPVMGQELSIMGEVVVRFNQAMDAVQTAAAWKLLNPEGQTVRGQITWSDTKTLSFKPTSPLALDSTYQVVLGKGAASAEGKSLLETMQWSFDTVGELQVSQTFPEGRTFDVANDSVITTIFNRPVVPLVPVPGEPACYRCLLGVASDRESHMVSRRLANKMLDKLLDNWEMEPAIGGTIAEIPIQQVEESELELRFRQAIWTWAKKQPKVTVRDIAASSPYQSFQLTFEEQGETHSWKVDQERKLTDTSIVTQPDFLFTPTSGSGQEVAVYLDGYAYHAQPPKGLRTVADDAAKRESVRESGRLVWSLTWDDVNRFADAVEAGRAPAASPFWSADSKVIAQHYPSAGLDAGVADRNPMDLLLGYLAGPERSAWTGLAASWVYAAIQLGSKGAIASGEASEWLAEAGSSRSFAGTGDGPIKTRRVQFDDSSRLSVAVDTTAPAKSAMWWTAVLSLRDDRSVGKDEAIHRRRWHRWLRWGNVLQFLTGPRRDAIITSHAHAKTIDWADYDLVTGVAQVATELEFQDADLVDPAALGVVLALIEEHGELPEIGLELESGLLVEAAFHQAKLAVVLGVDAGRDMQLEADGWTVQVVDADEGEKE